MKNRDESELTTRNIYYFTGTGNSLVVARDIAREIDADLISIRSVMESTTDKETIAIEADTIGLVFPAYYTRIPGIVERFIGKIDGLQNKYIYAVVTVGGIAGSILQRFSEIIGKRGGVLTTGFIVRMPANYIDNNDALPLFIQKRIFKRWKKQLPKVADAIRQRKSSIQKRFNPVMTLLFSGMIEKQYRAGELNPDVDTNFWVDDKCLGCGTCARICPSGNIILLDDRPVWQHHCDKCLACIQWCPQQAIQFSDKTLKRTRYHHPEIKLNDMLPK